MMKMSGRCTSSERKGHSTSRFLRLTLLLILASACLRTTSGHGATVAATRAAPAMPEIRSYDGRNNNFEHPFWGATETARVRVFPPQANFLDDNSHTPITQDNMAHLPSARRVMEELFRQAPPHKDKTTSHILLELGHFIVQDILGSSSNESEPLFIPCDGNVTDYMFCPVTGQSYPIPRDNNATKLDDNDEIFVERPDIAFHRQTHMLRASQQQQEKTRQTQRNTVNGMTSFLDLSNLYGVTEEDVKRMQGTRGRLKTTSDGLPDLSATSQGMKDGTNTSPGAYSIYVLFLRYHNVLADEYYHTAATATNITSSGTMLSDEEIFQLARRKTIAVYQSLVEEKYIPTLLGDKLDTYHGYDPSTDPSIDEFFAAVSFRYAHTSFSSLVRVVDVHMQPTPADPLFLRDVFKQDVPSIVANHGGIEPFLRGLTVTPVKAVDGSFVDDMNVWAEGTSVLDVQRGRDVGIPFYNDVREAFGVPRVTSIEELVVGVNKGDYNASSRDSGVNDLPIVTALKALYHDNVDLVDAYVGAVVERPVTTIDTMGPLFTLSIKDQFTRLRDGDRFWYKNIFPKEEYEAFPDLSELAKLVCDGMENFPDDPYVLAPGFGGRDTLADSAECSASEITNQFSFLGGDFMVRWHVDEGNKREDTETTIDVSLTVTEEMEGPGYIGIGWGQQRMNGAHIWFCSLNFTELMSMEGMPDECSANATTSLRENAFSCCLAPGTHHNVPVCAEPGDEIYYTLEVVDWCLSKEESSVTVRALVCSDDDVGGNNNVNVTSNECFQMSSTPDGKMDFIVAFNPLSNSRPHGYQRRTNAQVDLIAGILTKGEAQTADKGLIATHGVLMLVGWMVLAPWGVFIVRYMKTRTWRLVAHISIMGFVGSMMVPLLIGVEASVGASDKTADHSLVGLIIMGVFFIMAGTGRYRYIKWQGQKIGKMRDFFSLIIHKYGGAVFIALSWWNCYTGLVRISPEDSNFQLVVLSSYSMGYDMNIFGFIKNYLYAPYLAFIIAVFFVAEARKRRTNAKMTMQNAGSLWNDDDSHLECMTMETFLNVTRLGNALCVVDGRVLDITDFVDNHPGGPDLLRYVRGSDITEEFVGHRDVDGIRHSHSSDALALMKRFVVAKLVVDKQSALGREGIVRGIQTSMMSMLQQPENSTALPFRRGKVLDVKYLAPAVVSSDQTKPVVLMRLSLPRTGDEHNKEKRVTKIPSCSFRFRGIDKRGQMFEREYTALRLDHDKSIAPKQISLANLDAAAGSSKSLSEAFAHDEIDDECYDFIISLIPGGQMSNFFLGLKTGKLLLAQGPKVNSRAVSIFKNQDWKSVILLAGGTGVASMLQVIDFYLARKRRGEEVPRLFLLWILKSPANNYQEILGIKARVKRSRGRLKWVIVYSSSDDTKNSKKPSLKASVLQNPPEGINRTLSHPWTSVSRSNAFTNLFRSKKRTKVRDLIVSAQKTDFFSEDDLGNSGCYEALDGNFWLKPPAEMTRQLDQAMVKEVLESVEEYSRHQSGESKSPNTTSAPPISSDDDDDEDDATSVGGSMLYNVVHCLKSNLSVQDREDENGLTQKECFLAKEVIDCLLIFGYASSRDAAMFFGRSLQQRNILEAVSGDAAFSDGGKLFRFVQTQSSLTETSSDFSTGGEEKPTRTASTNLVPFNLSDISSKELDATELVSVSSEPIDNGDFSVPLRPAAVREDVDINVDAASDTGSIELCPRTLIALSGSPFFEADMISMLEEIGLPQEQLITFTASTQQV